MLLHSMLASPRRAGGAGAGVAAAAPAVVAAPAPIGASKTSLTSMRSNDGRLGVAGNTQILSLSHDISMTASGRVDAAAAAAAATSPFNRVLSPPPPEPGSSSHHHHHHHAHTQSGSKVGADTQVALRP